MKDMMMNKQEKYKKLLELQRQYRAGTIKNEDLSLEQKILLNRLYDIELQKLEAENEKNLNKIMKYRKKINSKNILRIYINFTNIKNILSFL